MLILYINFYKYKKNETFCFNNIISPFDKLCSNNYNLVGTLFVKDGATMNYSIYFKEIKGKINDGYSITGLGTNYETKSDISGTISKNNLLIKENGVLKTEWKSSNYNEFCH